MWLSGGHPRGQEGRRNFVKALWGKMSWWRICFGGIAWFGTAKSELPCGYRKWIYIVSFVFLLVHRKSKNFWDKITIKKDLKEMIFGRQMLLRSGWHSDTRPCAMSSASCLMPWNQKRSQPWPTSRALGHVFYLFGLISSLPWLTAVKIPN